MTEDTGDVALWPTRENYARFRAVCDDCVPNTFDEFEVLAVAKTAELAAKGIQVKRIDFDPDDMAVWCRANFGKVNSIARSVYAAIHAIAD
jgi:hypothetical protein